jgi:hypothetical protein
MVVAYQARCEKCRKIVVDDDVYLVEENDEYLHCCAKCAKQDEDDPAAMILANQDG